jgi:hypothetical protein
MCYLPGERAGQARGPGGAPLRPLGLPPRLLLVLHPQLARHRRSRQRLSSTHLPRVPHHLTLCHTQRGVAAVRPGERRDPGSLQGQARRDGLHALLLWGWPLPIWGILLLQARLQGWHVGGAAAAAGWQCGRGRAGHRAGVTGLLLGHTCCTAAAVGWLPRQQQEWEALSTWGLQQQLDMLCEAAHARGGPRGPASLMMKCGCATRWRVLAPACTAQCELPPAAACGGGDKERTCHLVRQAVL